MRNIPLSSNSTVKSGPTKNDSTLETVTTASGIAKNQFEKLMDQLELSATTMQTTAKQYAAGGKVQRTEYYNPMGVKIN